MRTTLTIDNDLAGVLRRRAREQAQPFKQVVNDLLRAGLAANGEDSAGRKRVTVTGKALGLKPGYDPGKLNQLVDELETEAFLERQRRL